MRNDGRLLAYSYLRLSREEAERGESSSISNQRMIIQDYCSRNGITLLQEFVDDGWSGGNFARPDFQRLIQNLEEGKANVVITKDLSRLGRDMRESSFYAEEFFPERGIRYLTVLDNFDTAHENVLAPFQFAMNEVYLRDGSKKVKEVLKSKREKGLYCACPPYGYKKDPRDNNRLIPDEMTAPVVRRIFSRAAAGDSTRTISMDLNADGIIPPLKYRVLYRDDFSDEGAAYASDTWNQTTIKRILKNKVYLGVTVLGKSRKASIKSKKKIPVPKEAWAITENTHEPLVSRETFDLAQLNLGRGNMDYRQYEHVRKSIFSGIAYCSKCGAALCSSGTVYKGERLKYWYLSCIKKRQDIADPCSGVRIRYTDLVEVVRQELNSLIALSAKEKADMVRDIMRRTGSKDELKSRRVQREKAVARITTIDKIVTKLYTDNAEGKLDDDRLHRMVESLETESSSLKKLIAELSVEDPSVELERNYSQFFDLVSQFSHIEELDRNTLVTFVSRIEVGPKLIEENYTKVTHRNQPFRQNIRIFYKFIGELPSDSLRRFPNNSVTTYGDE